MPASGAPRPRARRCTGPGRPSASSSTIPVPTIATRGGGADAGEQAREPLGQRDVVGVEPRNVPALRPVETAVQGRREPELLLVAEQETRGSEAAARSSGVPSVDASSTTTSSRSTTVCLSTLSSAKEMWRWSLWTASSTDTRGTGASVRRVADRGLPSFDLVVATVDRVEELGGCSTRWRSRHTVPSAFSSSTRTRGTCLTGSAGRPRSSRDRAASMRAGASRTHGTRAGTAHAPTSSPSPDDDCIYPDDLLERGRALASQANPGLDGLTGRAATETDVRRRRGLAAALLTREKSGTARSRSRSSCAGQSSRELGGFDEELGLGSGGAVVIRRGDGVPRSALERGARIEYEPELSCSTRRSPLTPAGSAILAPRRCERRLHPAQAPLSAADGRAHARPTRRRRAARARTTRPRGDAFTSRRCAAAYGATDG